MKDFPQRSLLRTMWIGFFLGPFGVHRFYTGYKGSAWLQLVTPGLSTCWLTYDLVMVFMQKENTFGEASLAYFTEHPALRMLQFSIWGVGFAWVTADMARIMVGRFKDALGRPLLTSDEPTKP